MNGKERVVLWLSMAFFSIAIGGYPVSGQVVLPESRHLAGPLDSSQSAFGNQFFNFPPPLGNSTGRPIISLSGWVEITFGEPNGDLVEFTVDYDAVGIVDGTIFFEGGQIYEVRRNRAFPNPFAPNSGVLDLATGEIEQITVNPLVQNTVIAGVTRGNRAPFALVENFPPPPLPPLPFPPPEIPPELVRLEAQFLLDDEQRITGFEFHGLTVLIPPLLPLDPTLPPFAFGHNDEFFFPLPVDCVEGTPPENCPSAETHPDGIQLPLVLPLEQSAILNPNFDLVSRELREVPAQGVVASCAPSLTSDGVLAAAGGRLYSIGGFDGEKVTDRVDIYDPATNTWQVGPPMPLGVRDAQGAAIGDNIYVFGGRWKKRGAAVSLLQVLNTQSLNWQLRNSATLPVAQGAVAVVDGKLYVLAGKRNRPNGSPQGNLRVTRAVQIYDPATNTWELGERIPEYLDRPSAAAVGSQIYLIGGRLYEKVGGRVVEGEVTDEVYVFNTVTGEYAEGPPTVRGVYDATAVGVGDRIYLVGGRLEDGETQRDLQVLNLAQGSWRNGLGLPLPSSSSTAVWLGERLWTAGGEVRVGVDEAPGHLTDAVQIFDPGRGWTVCDSHPLFASSDVLNAAGAAVGPAEFAPGSLALVTGFNFSDEVLAAPPEEPFVPTELGGLSILVDGLPAPILGVSPNRVDFQIPFGIRTEDKVTLEILREGGLGQMPPVEIAVAETSPGIFLFNLDELREPVYLIGNGAVAFNEEANPEFGELGQLNFPANPARPTEVLTLLTTGLGDVFPPLGNGERAPADPPSVAIQPLTVTIDGRDAEVLGAILQPGEVGSYLLQVRVPEGMPSAVKVPVEVTAGEVTSNRAVVAVVEEAGN